ncbi:MAG: uroporphyrinogen-III C-methyltransferase [Phycisphaerae bacterium]|nr:uroporphyrinogen-III C-methyltransferase [Phycisphaerae bacterium]
MQKKLFKNCVYLIGAGPGDPGLITVRGRDLIARADVIVYDYLAAPQLLRHARSDAEIIYVGKQAGNHALPQDQINALLIEKARNNNTVVRLKGGDPFVFGRGGEEALELIEAGIAYEVIPGITASIAACAYAGIPVTHRDFASDFALITGHEDAGRTGDSQVDWASLGKWKGTLAFYMGVKNLPVILGRLAEHGMAADTPAALVHWGTTTRQRTLVGTVATLPELAIEHQFKPPSILVVGKVIQLRDRLSWFEKRPLFGKRIIVTRSRSQASDVVEQLGQLGADVLEFPTIRIEPPKDISPLQKAIDNLIQYHWIIFTSVNGVDAFFENLQKQNYDARRFGHAKVCAIGPATSERLKANGIRPDLIPPRFVAESVIEALTAVDDLKGKNILLPRADIARADLPETLKKLGADVDEVEAYRTVMDASPKEAALKAIAEDTVDWVTFTSSSTVRNFLSQVDKEKLTSKKIRLASIGPITSETIVKAGLNVDVEADEYTIPGLIDALCNASD